MAVRGKIETIPAGGTFLRPGGREGHWRNRMPDPDPDDQVACPFAFVSVAGTAAEATLDALKAQHPDITPILFGSPHEAGKLFERMGYRPQSAADWLQAAATFDVDDWLAQRQRELDDWAGTSGKTCPRRGPWPETVRTFNRLLVPDDNLTDLPKPTVIIGLLATSDPTETAAYLGFGGWNDCPKPPVHIVLARRWRDHYGAVQVSNTYESVEFRVAQPLVDRDEALQLAMLQYHYCTDSIPETLESAAADLIGATVWHFWWD